MDVEAQLREICDTPSGPYLRPFRPNAAWKNATVFIVGSNPATPLREQFRSFDEYWDSLTRHPAVFDKAYAAARDGEDSKTTKRVKELCSGLQGVNHLVTNAAPYPIAHDERVPSAQWNIGEQIFTLLLSQCEPQAIFAHGSKAQRLVEQVFGVSLDPFVDPDVQDQRSNGCLHLCAPHLSGAGMKRGATFSAATALPKFAKRIREATV